jgi:hypothetical protein
VRLFDEVDRRDAQLSGPIARDGREEKIESAGASVLAGKELAQGLGRGPRRAAIGNGEERVEGLFSREQRDGAHGLGGDFGLLVAGHVAQQR